MEMVNAEVGDERIDRMRVVRNFWKMSIKVDGENRIEDDDDDAGRRTGERMRIRMQQNARLAPVVAIGRLTNWQWARKPKLGTTVPRR